MSTSDKKTSQKVGEISTNRSGHTQAQILAYTLAGLSESEEDLHMIFNMSGQTLEAPLPSIPGRCWHFAPDTWWPAPDDIVERARQRAYHAAAYRVGPRSVVVLEGRT